MIRFEGITKRFAGVTALDGVSFEIRAGECHALVGENGAGKSTLAKILAGIHRPDAGEVILDGRAVRFASPRDAREWGIGMVQQELVFCPELSVAENLLMGLYPRRRWGGVDRPAMYEAARKQLERLGLELDVRQPMKYLSPAQEQMVQIAAAVATGARVLIFDEPTSSLSEAESRALFDLIRGLKSRGTTILYVSHRLAEIFLLADRITVLRDGRRISTLDRQEANQERLVQMMVGRVITAHEPAHLRRTPGSVVLRVRNFSSPGRFRNVSFEVREGEIVGVAGLVGAGRSELAQALFGLDDLANGEVEVAGRRLRLNDVRRAMQAGLGLVPEDRKRQGLVLLMGCRQNFSLAILERLRRWLRIDQSRERELAERFFDRLAVKAAWLDAPVATLSGGNQQKVVIARWLARGSRVLIVDEPTRGVDVAAKAAIHQLLDEVACQGTAILLISSELPELLALSRRILVMRQGQLVGEVPREKASEENLLRLMAGVA